MVHACCASSSVLGDAVNRLSNGLDLLSLVVRYVEAELFFQLHDKFDDVQRVSPRISGATSVR